MTPMDADGYTELRDLGIDEAALPDNTFLHDWIEAGNRPRTRRPEQAHLYALMESARRALEILNRRLHGHRAVWH